MLGESSPDSKHGVRESCALLTGAAMPEAPARVVHEIVASPVQESMGVVHVRGHSHIRGHRCISAETDSRSVYHGIE
jgi:hypothetical protein